MITASAVGGDVALDGSREVQLQWSGIKTQSALVIPQAGAEPGLEEESPAFAATVEEPRKERTPRLDWAGLLKVLGDAADVRIQLARVISDDYQRA